MPRCETFLEFVLEVRSVKDTPFYCQSSVGTIPFQGRVFLLLAFCKQNASLQQLLSHMATVCLSTNCPRANSIIKSSWPHELGKVELGATWIWHGLVPGKCWLNALQKMWLCPTLCIVHNRAGCIRFRTVLEFVLEFGLEFALEFVQEFVLDFLCSSGWSSRCNR